MCVWGGGGMRTRNVCVCGGGLKQEIVHNDS